MFVLVSVCVIPIKHLEVSPKISWNSPLAELYICNYIKKTIFKKTTTLFYFWGTGLQRCMLLLCWHCSVMQIYYFSRSWSKAAEMKISPQPTFAQTANSITTFVKYCTVVHHSFRLLVWPPGCLYHIKQRERQMHSLAEIHLSSAMGVPITD